MFYLLDAEAHKLLERKALEVKYQKLSEWLKLVYLGKIKSKSEDVIETIGMIRDTRKQLQSL
jgi:hypothetical protein